MCWPNLLQGQDVERVQRLRLASCDLLALRRLPGRFVELRTRRRRVATMLMRRRQLRRRSLLKYSIRIAISISTLPTSVYRKNLIAAYSFRGPPQTPIRKYIGSSMTSQNT